MCVISLCSASCGQWDDAWPSSNRTTSYPQFNGTTKEACSRISQVHPSIKLAMP